MLQSFICTACTNGSVFVQEWPRELWSDQQEKVLFASMQQHLRSRQKGLEESAAIIGCLQLQLIMLACQDPGPEIASKLVLPAIQERLQTNASQFNAEQASQTVPEVRVLLMIELMTQAKVCWLWHDGLQPGQSKAEMFLSHVCQ